MKSMLPTDRPPTEAEWEAFLDALPHSPGLPVAGPEEVTAASSAALSPPPPVAPAPVVFPGADVPPLDTSATDISVTPEGVPVPHFTPWLPARNRADGWTVAVQRVFMRELTRIGSARAAAGAVGRSVRSAYLRRAKPGAESFAAAWTAAVYLGIEQAQTTAIERALHGELVPRHRDGKFLGFGVKHNDRLLAASLGSHHTQGGRLDRLIGLEQYHYQLEQLEYALNVRLMRIGVGGQFPEERQAEAFDAHRAWEQEAAADKKRAYRAEIRAKLRAATKRDKLRAAAVAEGPRIRVL